MASRIRLASVDPGYYHVSIAGIRPRSSPCPGVLRAVEIARRAIATAIEAVKGRQDQLVDLIAAEPDEEREPAEVAS